MAKNDTTLKYRVGRVEKTVERVEGKIDEIMENHLPHIMTELEKLNGKVEANRTRFIVFSTFNVGAIIAGVLIAKYL